MLTKDDLLSNNEAWKTIPGYEEYMVSNLGRVKRLAYYKRIKDNGKQFQPERILKPYHIKNGYLSVSLSKRAIVKRYLVHRLVAMTFIPNPNNYPFINHKDENTSNNRVENLEWCTAKYNLNYGTRMERWREKVVNGKRSKIVCQYDKYGNFIREFPSIHEVCRVLKLTYSGISACCNGNKKHKKCGGYLWKFKDSDKKIIPIKKILQLTKEGICINTYYSVKEASASTKIGRTAISLCIAGKTKTSGGFIWKRES